MTFKLRLQKHIIKSSKATDTGIKKYFGTVSYVQSHQQISDVLADCLLL